ncbi:MAG TPA: 4-(cytidine 5'-diphospho)-2-C-methyl-D-erythritol kinase [Ohtaekwangia sp.]|nr:4-(cytidine 5'-diphospho)-2-C-methyl-D-erythritol kinase [Ohtaekwangia sp.]
MISFAPCKINLGLHIIGKRPDGYHDLETCFYPVPWTDIVEIIDGEKTAFTSTGIQIPGAAEDNLCLKAYRVLARDHTLPPVHIHLHKVLPSGAGLGGGSSDGAHTLRLLNEKFSLHLSADELIRYAAALGSDCPFFIHNSPMIGTGRGEILRGIPLSLSGKYLVLLKPGIHVSTAEAFRTVKPAKRTRPIADIITTIPVTHWKNTLENDFESGLFNSFPVIGELKESLYRAGALYASMSGSGSSVFGIFQQPVGLSAFEPFIIWAGLLP